jgi:hypothetical protein
MVLKCKITREEWSKIGRLNYATDWLQPFCSYVLVKDLAGKFRREQYLSWFAYCIMFIPLHLIKALWYMWDGGLKEFEFQDRCLGVNYFTAEDPAYAGAVEVWKEHVPGF